MVKLPLLDAVRLTSESERTSAGTKKSIKTKRLFHMKKRSYFFSLHMVQEVGLGEKGKGHQNNRAISHFVAVVKL